MANIYWRDIPVGACVIDTGRSYRVTKYKKNKSGRWSGKAVAYWSGNEAGPAQRRLYQLAKQPCRR